MADTIIERREHEADDAAKNTLLAIGAVVAIGAIAYAVWAANNDVNNADTVTPGVTTQQQVNP